MGACPQRRGGKEKRRKGKKSTRESVVKRGQLSNGEEGTKKRVSGIRGQRKWKKKRVEGRDLENGDQLEGRQRSDVVRMAERCKFWGDPWIGRLKGKIKWTKDRREQNRGRA